MGIRINVGGEAVANAVKVAKETKGNKIKEAGKAKKGVVAPNVPQPQIKELGAKIKKLQQEIKRIEKSSLPTAEKERLLKAKKSELGKLTREMAQKHKKGAAVLLPNNSRASKKKTAMTALDTPEKVKKKLTELKDKLKKANKDLPGAMESIRDLKSKIKQLEAKLGPTKNTIKV